MNKTLRRYAPFAIFLGVVLILGIHLVFPQSIYVDWITIVLIVLLILIPYAPFLKRISFGGLEAELQPRIREIEKEVREIPAGEKERIGRRGAEKISEEFYSLLEEDHRLALAKLRMELENILRKILVSKGKETQRLSISRMVSVLESEEDMDKGALHAIRDVVGLCNQAVHGEEIRKQDATDMVDLGLELLDYLYSYYHGKVVEPQESEPLSEEDLEEYQKGRYEVTTVVPLVEEPYLNKRVLTQEELNQFLEEYEEFGEFLVKIEKIE